MDNDYGKRLKIFLDNNIGVHIVLNNNKWINGFIKSLGAEFCIINEFKFGDTLVFFSDIAVLETYTKEIKE